MPTEWTESEINKLAFAAARKVLLENGIDPEKQKDNQSIFSWLYSLDMEKTRAVWNWITEQFDRCKDVSRRVVIWVAMGAISIGGAWLLSGGLQALKGAL